MKLTPQQWIDLPGAGMAEKQLRKDGRWNEAKAFDGSTPITVTVKVTGYYEPEIETQYITVTATSEEEAFDMAEDKSDFDTIEGIVIETAKEAQCN